MGERETQSQKDPSDARGEEGQRWTLAGCDGVWGHSWVALHRILLVNREHITLGGVVVLGTRPVF